MIETMTAFKNYEYNMDLTEGMYKYIGEKGSITTYEIRKDFAVFKILALTNEEMMKEIRVKEQQQEQEDARGVQAKLQELRGVKDSPQYQAAQDQKHSAKQEESQEQAKMEGNEIIQLQHTKL